MVGNMKRKLVFIKWKSNHVVFSRATILSFHPVCVYIYIYILFKMFYGMLTLGLFYTEISLTITISNSGTEMFGLFNGISTLYGLFIAEISFICKCLIKIITISIFNIPLQSFFSIALFLKKFFYKNHSLAQLYPIKFFFFI